MDLLFQISLLIFLTIIAFLVLIGIVIYLINEWLDGSISEEIKRDLNREKKEEK